MDFTKALDELKRVREYLQAVTLTEETIQQIALLSDSLQAMKKEHSLIGSAIGGMTEQYAKEKTAHDSRMKILSDEIQRTNGELVSLRKEIDAERKAFRGESERRMAEQKKEAREITEAAALLRAEAEVEKKKLEEIREAVRKVTSLAG